MERFIKSQQKVPRHAAYTREIKRAYLGEYDRFFDYVYGAICMSGAYPAAARLFDELARVTLAHCEQLGQILHLFGEDAALNTRILQSSKKGAEVTLLLDTAIHDEEEATHYYKKLAALAPVDAARHALSEISAEKEGHVVALSGLKARLSRT